MTLSNIELQGIEALIPQATTAEQLCDLSAKIANANPADWLEERRLYLIELDIQKQHKKINSD
jgi:hypothetical protein